MDFSLLEIFIKKQGETKRAYIQRLIAAHRANLWPYELKKTSSKEEKGTLTFTSKQHKNLKVVFSQNGNLIQKRELGLLLSIKKEAKEWMLSKDTNKQEAQKALPSTVKWAWKNIHTHGQGTAKFEGLSYDLGTDVVQIDLNSAYAQCALNLGIISQGNFDKLQKASKEFRLLALGALATKTTKTTAEKVRKTYVQNTLGNVEISVLGDAKTWAFSIKRICEGLEKEPTKPAFCTKYGVLRRKTNVKTRKNTFCETYPLGYGKNTATVIEELQETTEEYRPETAPVFFYIASKVAEAMKIALTKIEGAYFYWFDALFVPRSKVQEATELIKSLGYPTKTKVHNRIYIERGGIYVDDKAYFVGQRYTNQGFAAYNAFAKKVQERFSKLDASNFAEFEDEARRTGVSFADVSRALNAMGLTMSDVFDVCEAWEVRGDFFQENNGSGYIEWSAEQINRRTKEAKQLYCFGAFMEEEGRRFWENEEQEEYYYYKREVVYTPKKKYKA